MNRETDQLADLLGRGQERQGTRTITVPEKLRSCVIHDVEEAVIENDLGVFHFRRLRKPDAGIEDAVEDAVIDRAKRDEYNGPRVPPRRLAKDELLPRNERPVSQPGRS